jgi:hypothetical protein
MRTLTILMLFALLVMACDIFGQNRKPIVTNDTFPCNKWKYTVVKTDSGWLHTNTCYWNVVKNDADLDGDWMRIMRFNGRVMGIIDSVVLKDTGVFYLTQGGQFMVNCNPGWRGTVTFTYTVNDGNFILGIWKGKSGAPSKGIIIYRKEW